MVVALGHPPGDERGAPGRAISATRRATVEDDLSGLDASSTTSPGCRRRSPPSGTIGAERMAELTGG